ncbi:MAG: arginine repressor [Clostridia bacterium]|nr:arginine repressor [Clostridia bacterium]
MKNKRQEKILEIINKSPIYTQDDLQSALLNYGFKVTQSTVSRDIRELKLVKSHDDAGNYCYVAPKQYSSETSKEFKQVMLKSVKEVDYAVNDVVIKCMTGMAQSVCVALESEFADVMLGSIAGDDTVLLIARSEQDAQWLTEQIKVML